MREPSAMHNDCAICWFRQDLRLSDHPALCAASRYSRVLAVYIDDDHHAGRYAMGEASRWWLYHSLASLNAQMSGCLSLFRGDPIDILLQLVQRHAIAAVYWNRSYEPWSTLRDLKIAQRLRYIGVEVAHFNGSLLWEPEQIQKKDGSNYQVFSAYYRKGCLLAPQPRKPLHEPSDVRWYAADAQSLTLDQLKLPSQAKWALKLASHWSVGEQAARQRLERFVHHALEHYTEGRDIPAQSHTSRLSPHLHFGEVSVHMLWHRIEALMHSEPSLAHSAERFLMELGWREFSYYLLYHFAELPLKNWQQRFERFPWQHDAALIEAWCQGQTGIPMVDAGMRELYATGSMHNRLRMVTGSFLVKNLLQHWHHGERWFWNHLVDADLANNSAGWQWIAGCGADAAPYFRIFNPLKQAERFDPQGAYIRRWLPEIAALPVPHLFSPHQAPQHILTQAGVRLGKTYPMPIVELNASRQRALAAFQSL